jgi:hypothetical protein
MIASEVTFRRHAAKHARATVARASNRCNQACDRELLSADDQKLQQQMHQPVTCTLAGTKLNPTHWLGWQPKSWPQGGTHRAAAKLEIRNMFPQNRVKCAAVSCRA